MIGKFAGMACCRHLAWRGTESSPSRMAILKVARPCGDIFVATGGYSAGRNLAIGVGDIFSYRQPNWRRFGVMRAAALRPVTESEGRETEGATAAARALGEGGRETARGRGAAQRRSAEREGERREERRKKEEEKSRYVF